MAGSAKFAVSERLDPEKSEEEEEITMSAVSLERHVAAAKTLPRANAIIDGHSFTITSGEVFDHINPATGLKQAEIALASAHDVDVAVASARRAFPSWRATPPAKRSRILRRLADLVEQNKERIARISALENG